MELGLFIPAGLHEVATSQALHACTQQGLGGEAFPACMLCIALWP